MKLKLIVLAEKLKLDGYPRLNPCCELSRIDNFGKINKESEVVIGETETIPNTNDACWVKQFEIDFENDQDNHYSVKLYHNDGANKLLIVSGARNFICCLFSSHVFSSKQLIS